MLSARDLVRQIPAEWQETVKHRAALSYGAFLRQIQDPRREGRIPTWFWGVQEIPDILERWGHDLPPEHVHVVTVPPRREVADALESRYFGVLGVDHTRLRAEQTRSNTSLGTAQAELLRRVNVALGDRLPKPRLGYARVAKWFLTERFLVPQGEEAKHGNVVARKRHARARCGCCAGDSR